MKIQAILSIIVSIISLVSCNLNGFSEKENLISSFEFKGAVLAHIHNSESGYGSPSSEYMHGYLKNIGYDSVQLNTFAYMKSSRNTEIYYGSDPTLSDKKLIEEIRSLKEKNLKVVLKPHIWIGGLSFDPDNWRNKIDFDDRKQLEKWFENYSGFIIDQAKLAQKTKVDLFVVGTELASLAKYEKYWERLINDVRNVYKGKLTYAAEGSGAQNIRFWDKLDYIGIDAYFSLGKNISPDVEELVLGWEKYDDELEKLSVKYGKKIVFTEVGYKSVVGTSIRPWQWMDNDSVMSEEAQADCYRALFEFIKNKPYMEGIFIWKYFTDMNSREESENIEKGFTPFKKEAEKIVSDYFLPNT